MRTILFATRRVTAGDGETAVFIGILLLFAVAASAVVLREGLKVCTVLWLLWLLLLLVVVDD
jgi:hypothetical protein